MESTPLLLALIYFAAVNFCTFFLMFADKKLAEHRAYRIPEKTLFFFSCIGGAAGGLLGMYLFHHKTRRAKFNIGIPLILCLQILLALILLWIYGANQLSM